MLFLIDFLIRQVGYCVCALGLDVCGKCIKAAYVKISDALRDNEEGVAHVALDVGLVGQEQQQHGEDNI